MCICVHVCTGGKKTSLKRATEVEEKNVTITRIVYTQPIYSYYLIYFGDLNSLESWAHEETTETAMVLRSWGKFTDQMIGTDNKMFKSNAKG